MTPQATTQLADPLAKASSAPTSQLLVAARLPADADGLGPVQLAYLAACLLLPIRLAVLLRAWAEVPALAAEVKSAVDEGLPPLTRRVRRSSSPYAELVRLLVGTKFDDEGRRDFEAARKRALRKAGQRTLRSQALDVASLLLLLWLVAGRSPALGPLVIWGVSWIALMLLCTILARASLQHRLETATTELGVQLTRATRSVGHSSTCAFCDATVSSIELEVRLPAGSVATSGVLCSACGKVVASLPNPARSDAPESASAAVSSLPDGGTGR
jgi:hypothetical protein